MKSQFTRDCFSDVITLLELSNIDRFHCPWIALGTHFSSLAQMTWECFSIPQFWAEDLQLSGLWRLRLVSKLLIWCVDGSWGWESVKGESPKVSVLISNLLCLASRCLTMLDSEVHQHFSSTKFFFLSLTVEHVSEWDFCTLKESSFAWNHPKCSGVCSSATAWDWYDGSMSKVCQISANPTNCSQSSITFSCPLKVERSLPPRPFFPQSRNTPPLGHTLMLYDAPASAARALWSFCASWKCPTKLILRWAGSYGCCAWILVSYKKPNEINRTYLAKFIPSEFCLITRPWSCDKKTINQKVRSPLHHSLTSFQ